MDDKQMYRILKIMTNEFNPSVNFNKWLNSLAIFSTFKSRFNIIKIRKVSKPIFERKKNFGYNCNLQSNVPSLPSSESCFLCFVINFGKCNPILEIAYVHKNIRFKLFILLVILPHILGSVFKNILIQKYITN